MTAETSSGAWMNVCRQSSLWWCCNTTVVLSLPVQFQAHTRFPFLNWFTTFSSNTKPQQQPLDWRRKRSIAYKATPARRTTQQLSWNNLLHSRQQQQNYQQVTTTNWLTNYSKPRGEPRLSSLGPASNPGPKPRSLQCNEIIAPAPYISLCALKMEMNTNRDFSPNF